MTDTELQRRKAICEVAGVDDIGNLSDGFHTFNGLYEQRMILFAALVNAYKDKSWKSYRHEDGEYCFGGGWFIVGIDTPEGSYTYHYENRYWNMFDCVDLPRAKHWDGHTEADAKTRLMSLEPEIKTDGDTISRQAAIDALKNRWKKTRNYEGIGDDIAEECELYLKQVPSAQPEWHESPKNTLYIRKADAIEICMKQIESPINTYFEKGTAEIIKEKITELPSVQPEKRTEERAETHACDLIDRQAAIEVIDAVFPVDPMKTEYAQGIACGAALAKTYVEQLPSAQPEIIRCKDCKHFHYDMPYVIQGIPVLGHEVCDFWGDGCKTSENGFCSFAEE